MDSTFDIREIPISLRRYREKVTRFLAEAELDFDERVQLMIGVYDSDDNLLGCGALDGDIIKCLALSERLRGEGVAALLVTRLLNEAFSEGVSNVKVFTKPEYHDLFADMGFSLVGKAPKAIMMESDSRQLKKYKDYLSRHRAQAVIVANANPTTLGHLCLIETAAKSVESLAVIPVAENSSNMFSYSRRVDMLRNATAHLKNVEILEGSDYAVSASTFPSYFIKKKSDVSATHAALDLDIFARHLAPALGAKIRFVGTEPTDALTAEYNEAMKSILPQHGIAVKEINRLTDTTAQAISASRVRYLLENGSLYPALKMVPATTVPALLAALAVRALRMELELEPKPGLVDPSDSGSHNDMDFKLMSRAITALDDYFYLLAKTAFDEPNLSVSKLKEIGLQGEDMMNRATGGVNTHKGAIFSMGLAVAATMRIIAHHTQHTISEEIAVLASGLTPASGTHGEQVRKTDGVPGALQAAQKGYPELFTSWLPMRKSMPDSTESRLKLLLKIIAEIDDSNAIYRAGAQAAANARDKVAKILQNFSIEALRQLNEEFKRINISHGGAADMLSLTFFIDTLDNITVFSPLLTERTEPKKEIKTNQHI